MYLRNRLKLSFAETFRTIFSPLTVFIWATSIIGGTIGGPFGTYAIMDWPERGVYWIVVVTIAVLVGYCVRALCVALVGTDRPRLLDLSMAIWMTVAFTPILYMVTRTARSAELLELQPVWSFAGYVFFVTTIIMVGRRVVPGIETRGYGDTANPAPVRVPAKGAYSQPRIFRRLETDARDGVLRLSANDHVVEVVTSSSAHKLRMRLIDAIAEMEPIHGYCVHRSHWVAHDAIQKVERTDDYKLFVVLKNGDRIPVSRKYRANLEQAGLI